MAQETEKKPGSDSSTLGLLESMETQSGLTYVDGCELKRTECRRKESGEIERALFDGIVTKSDMFVLRCLARLNWGTIAMVQDMLGHEKGNNTEKDLIYPSHEYDAVKKSLARLVSNALVNKYQFTAPGAREYCLYCITEQGFLCLRRILYYDGVYEHLNALNDYTEILKRIGATHVGLYVANLKGITAYQVFNENGYFKSLGKFSFYGRVFSEINGQKYVTMIEPFYFHFNKSLISADTIERIYEKRIKVIWEYKKILEAEEKILRVIVVVEDKKGFVDAVKVLTGSVFSDKELVEMMYFTSRELICTDRKNPEKRFLRIDSIVNGKPKVKANEKIDFVP